VVTSIAASALADRYRIERLRRGGAGTGVGREVHLRGLAGDHVDLARGDGGAVLLYVHAVLADRQ